MASHIVSWDWVNCTEPIALHSCLCMRFMDRQLDRIARKLWNDSQKLSHKTQEKSDLPFHLKWELQNGSNSYSQKVEITQDVY